VKPDLLRATMAHRARLGQVLVIDPLGASGVTAARWSPLASCSTWAGAQQMAVMLANAIEQTPTEEQRPEHRFWKTMGTKFLAPMLFAAATKGLGMAEVLHWLDSREDQEVKDILEAAGVPAAQDAWESSQYRTDRAVDSLYATAEEVLHVYGNQRVSASTDGHDLDLDHFLSGDNTIYLYAPAHQQRLLRPLFETITQQVVAAAQEKAALAPDGMLSPRLGLFLDEAGNCAALSDLDVLATTARGQGIQLVTVWHDKSQLEARYGPKVRELAVFIAALVTSGRRVLVHCTEGLNRSGVVVARALMAMGLTASDAIDLVRRRGGRWRRRAGSAAARRSGLGVWPGTAAHSSQG
jgi:type IV secretory pathway TraG/TraD family ATPase VirD4